MKVFISSLISSYEPYRQAAKAAVRALRHDPVMAEDFGALASSPQIACLRGVREADLVLLILLDRYGSPQGNSSVSPTHEEYLEARGAKEILVFVHAGVEREPRQQQFVDEVGAWQKGHFRASFKTPDELRDQITGAIHGFELSRAAAPLNPAALRAAALALLPASLRHQGGPSMLNLTVAGGPAQSILRPADLEASELSKALRQQALFGTAPIFDAEHGARAQIMGDALVIEQQGGARIALDERGGIALRLPLERSRGDRGGFGALFALIEETVMAQLCAAIGYAAWALERVDPTQRLTHLSVAASIDASEHLGWRTQAEQDASPSSGTMRMGSSASLTPVAVDRARAALSFDASRLAEDLMVPLRRQRKGR
jgi:hypothetical protein